MPDSRALLRLVDEFVWVVRRNGIDVSTSQTLDVVRAIRLVGFERRNDLFETVASIVVTRERSRVKFTRAFDEFFGSRTTHRDLWSRLADQGFTEAEIAIVREVVESWATAGQGAHLGALLERGPELDRLLTVGETRKALEGVQSVAQAGFYTHKIVERVGVRDAKSRLAAVRSALRDALGKRGDALTDALGRELELAAESIRAEVRRRATAAEHSDASGRAIVRRDETPFTALRGEEVEAVRRAVRALVERLRGGEMVRARRAKRGRLDVSKTMRAAYRTGGVPFVPERRNRRRDKARLVLLCDVSDSVRAVSTFLLEFAYAAQDLFAKTRTFVFVSELGETTNLFESNPIQVALGRAYGGSVISVVDNSNYGRVFASFVERVLPSIDRRTTVVILGDGRTNFHDDGASHLDAIRERARSLVWLCPEPRSAWASGDSAMRRYAEKCSTVLSVRTVEELEVAARRLVALR